MMRPVISKSGKKAHLHCEDRLFYNQVFYLKKPTLSMLKKSIDGTKCAIFDKNRFIAVAGRNASHVFDLDKMDFILMTFRKAM